MKVVIIAGGYGTRISEETITKPKPMVEIGNEPILIHILKYFSSFRFNDFVIALGFKGDYIKSYMYDYMNLDNDLTLNFKSKTIRELKKQNKNWNVTLIDTGQKTNTGGRLKRLEKFLKKETFLFTYGDGVSDVDLNKLISTHKRLKTLVTLTAVKAPPRFGNLKIYNNKIEKFTEKDQNADEWINGGFMVMEPEIFNFLKSDNDSLEFDALESLGKKKLLGSYKHSGFWKCMDSLKDKEILNEIWNSKKVPWKK